MARETTSKNFDGITDLVVIAPIKDGFINAYENVTYATRLKVVSEALNKVRLAAREFETVTPFADVTERILTLLDFRIGVLDKDLFSVPLKGGGLKSQRYLYLTATFDGAWEPYMRLIWDPMGPFLDLMFCNCEGYVTAVDHSFEDFAQWVRDNQMDSAIFYATTGLTIRDQTYLNRLEQVQRKGPFSADTDLEMARLVGPNPDANALAQRNQALTDIAKDDLAAYLKIHELALEVLTVLYRLADFYPPEWLAGPMKGKLGEGRYLARVAHSILRGWDDLIPTAGPLLDIWKARILPEAAYGQILRWYNQGKKHIDQIANQAASKAPKDPTFQLGQVQGGILKPVGTKAKPVRLGALLFFTIKNAHEARVFIKKLEIHYAGANVGENQDTFLTIGFTPHGLRRMGLKPDVIDHFPKEFREGMEQRSGLLGDMRENHPRNWQLPPRNWPPLPADAGPFAKARPPVEFSEVDFVLQVRTTNSDQSELEKTISAHAEKGKDRVVLISVDFMHSNFSGPDSEFEDHFGFRDGISQPRPRTSQTPNNPKQPDEVALGEVLLGYANDRDDYAPSELAALEPWRQKNRAQALSIQQDGTFLVIRKLEQHVQDFNDFVDGAVVQINQEHPTLAVSMDADRLKAKMLGRYPNGQPLVPATGGSLNGFDYKGDATGDKCPFASHVRRTNPRDEVHGRPTPRILRRGMLFGDAQQSGAPVGLMFMAYNASIAEQFETIQRWINGGNSTGVSSGHNDPLLGVAPKSTVLQPVQRTFKFVDNGEVIRVTMPKAFVTLHWGQYFFVPSQSGLAQLCELEGGYRVLDEALETKGTAFIARVESIGDPKEMGNEWKRALEDFDVKDPNEKDITPDIWSAVRYNHGGAMKIPPISTTAKSRPNWDMPPNADTQEIILCAGYKQVMRVLKDWKNFSVEEQLRRIQGNSGPIYVAQQPDNNYKNVNLQGLYNYKDEAVVTNRIWMSFDRTYGFETGHAAGKSVIVAARNAATDSRRNYFKLELRRQYLLPALAAMCHQWYGLPDGEHMFLGGWQWEPPTERTPPGPRAAGDFLSPSRNAFYPRPTPTVSEFAQLHGSEISNACAAFVAKHRANPTVQNTGSVGSKMFAAMDDDAMLARNIVGTMVGAIPPMDGNLRGVLAEWLGEKTLWRHQAALRRALSDRQASADPAAAMEALFAAVSQAMCKRPAPDLLYRTAVKNTEISRGRGKKPLKVKERDLVVVSLVSAAQRSLEDKPETGDLSIVFGGKRTQADQTSVIGDNKPVHACPAMEIGMGAIMGILAALLDAGRIQAMPASMIVKIDQWP